MFSTSSMFLQEVSLKFNFKVVHNYNFLGNFHLLPEIKDSFLPNLFLKKKVLPNGFICFQEKKPALICMY